MEVLSTGESKRCWEQAGQAWGRQNWRRYGGVLRYFFRADASPPDVSTVVVRAFDFRSTGPPKESASRYLIRDRDGTYGAEVRRCLDGRKSEEVL